MRPYYVSWLLLAFLLISSTGKPCDLCAVYRATNARGESSSGFLFTLSQQYIDAGTVQSEGKPYKTPVPDPFNTARLEDAFVDTSITHIVPTYNFSEPFGLSLNLPIIYRSFLLVQQVPGQFLYDTERGSVSGIGDASLIARWTLLRISEMKYSIVGTLFAGAKFPTGDTERLDREVDQERQLQATFGQSHAHARGGVHQHDLALGTGSYDSVFGGALTFRWDRWFFSSQAQYYLRTEANDYRFGDEIMISGGPGAYVLLTKKATLTLQANAVYDTMAHDEVLGQKSTETGWTAWYLGPQLSFTWKDHFSANAGVDIPLRIYNHGLQSVPDYRFHGGLTWKF